MKAVTMRPRSRLAFIAACLFVFLLLEVVPVGVVVLPLGLCAVGCLLVVDVPHAWRSIRRR
jgi:hypothetical protein